MHNHLEYKKLLSDLTPRYIILSAIVFLMILESVLSLITPWLAGQFTSVLLSQSPSISLSYKQILLIWILLLAFQSVVNFYHGYLSGTTMQHMLTRLRTRLYDHLQSLPLSYFHEHKQGHILSLITYDAALISSFVSETLLGLLPHLILICGALICIFMIKPLVALLAGLLIPLFYLTTKLLGRHIRPISREMIKLHADTLTIVEENLAILPIIKSYTREPIESLRFKNENQHLLSVTFKYLRIQSLLSPVIKFLATAIILFILLIISNDLSSGRLGPSDIVRLILYGIMLTQPISTLANIYGQVQRAFGAAEQLIEVFSLTPEPSETGIELPSVNGSIVFNNIHFQYRGRPPLLRGLNLIIHPGETVAITGKNGAGKSTMVHLLMRFADPNQGTITIDQQDIRTVNLTSLRRQIGIVQQQVLLQNSTVADNIRFGLPDASKEQIEIAARKAHALDFINKLPLGFETIIGDQGVKLSGGQKQRLSLARALIKDPAILIFDEATAMFDPEGEESFIRECHQILHGKTVILITHRPRSLSLADRIVTLKDGRIEKCASNTRTNSTPPY
jgi:ATP-binding cassette, subfamily B, bacterial